VLRDDLGLTGTRYGCGRGQCGACYVLADDRAVASCLLTADQAARMAITTVEGLADGAKLHPVQQAFVDGDALQCGYCTSGMVISADELDVPIERVQVVLGDTDQVPFDFGTFGSHSVAQEAPLLRKAAAFARRQLIDRASAKLGLSEDKLDTAAGAVVGGGKSVSYG